MNLEVKEISPNEARRLLEDRPAELIDIRDPGERKLRIPRARWVPLTGLEAGLKADPAEGIEIGIFHCRSGRRTRAHADTLATMGHAEMYVLSGGIEEWKKEGFEVESDAGKSIDIMRQVQIVAGSLVVLGVALGAWIHGGFFLLSGLIGAGLLFSGVTGSCGMASMLAKLPFNR